MAASIVGGATSGASSFFIRRFLSREQRFPFAIARPASLSHGVRAVISSTTSDEQADTDKIDNRDAFTSLNSTLACPICYKPLIGKNGQSSTKLECKTCKKLYENNESYLDLTLASGAEDFVEASPPSAELFRSPLVSFLYERGWRQSFVWGGFPGAEKEFEMAKDYLKSTFGGTVVDASCGSGLFSRMFSKSGLYKLVVALDFSENMLRQCSAFIEQENINKKNLILIRADIVRLPFASSSVEAVHAGAALHCWVSQSSAVAEISRVLRPGGVFVATTFILDGFLSVLPFSRMAYQIFNGVTGQRFFASEDELEDLCRTCGLVDFKCVRSGNFVMISATKPS